MMAVPQLKMPEFSDIVEASQRLKGRAVRTPLVRSDVLDEMTGGRIFLKPECLQRTGSFKFRGAWNFISRLNARDNSGGVVAYSSGNHAQGVAAAARMMGIPALIVMPEDAPAIKKRNTIALGAEIVTYDRFGENREQIGDAIASERSAQLVPPYEHPWIIAGQGTAGLELVEDLEELGETLDTMLVCTGGGGLTAGVALTVQEMVPNAKIYACEPEGFDDYGRSLAAGERVSNEPGAMSICDAIVTPTPGELTFSVNQPRLSGGLAVSEDEVRTA
ncbi:MAG: threonine/serine dehydratase, partial [Anderseniella sp.]|nr:threonine/serine dehydratase [Anderseniella sp.]